MGVYFCLYLCVRGTQLFISLNTQSWPLNFLLTRTSKLQYRPFVSLKQALHYQINLMLFTEFDKYDSVAISEKYDAFCIEYSLKIEKGLELVSRPHFHGISYNFLKKKIFFLNYINLPNFIARLCLLLKFSIICISCFILRHLMTSWHIWKVKIWLSQELLKRNNFFFLVSLVLFFRHTKQTCKNAADTTFK